MIFNIGESFIKKKIMNINAKVGITLIGIISLFLYVTDILKEYHSFIFPFLFVLLIFLAIYKDGLAFFKNDDKQN